MRFLIVYVLLEVPFKVVIVFVPLFVTLYTLYPLAPLTFFHLSVIEDGDVASAEVIFTVPGLLAANVSKSKAATIVIANIRMTIEDMILLIRLAIMIYSFID